MGALYSACENCFGADAKPNLHTSQRTTASRQNYSQFRTEYQTENADLKSSTNPFKAIKSMNTSAKSRHGRNRSGKGYKDRQGDDSDPNKKVTIQDFNFIKVLGRGAYGKVFLVQKKANKQYFALKTLKKRPIIKGDYVEQAMTERNVLQNSSNPFVMKLHFSFQNENTLYFVMDFCPGGELFTQLTNRGTFDEETTRFYAAEIILGLQHLHETMNVIYRDLKPKNILLDGSGHVKITDFGLSKEGNRAYTVCGTAEYVAPEVLQKVGYDKTVDWWSLGCLIYEMLVGMPPFFAKEKDKLEKQILEASPMIPHSISENAKDLLSKLLARDPAKRLGYNGAEEVKRHPFFYSIRWDEVLGLKMQPPIVPMLTRATDTRNFPKAVVDEPVTETPPVGSMKVQSGSRNPFKNFTYVHRGSLLHKPNPAVADNS